MPASAFWRSVSGADASGGDLGAATIAVGAIYGLR
jgi:hypothetical protein